MIQLGYKLSSFLRFYEKDVLPKLGELRAAA